jgi:hypothetical protein
LKRLGSLFGKPADEVSMPDQQVSLYVHLRADGGIFVVKGSGEEFLATEDQLLDLVRSVVDDKGVVIYSRDDPQHDPPAELTRVFKRMVDLRPTFQLLDKPHPHASLRGGATTLMQAAFASNLSLIDDLVRRGGTLEARDVDGMTALMYASNRGNGPATSELIRLGAVVNARDAEGNTPLMFAAQGGHEAIVDQLLRAGADLHLQGKAGFTAFEFARQNGHAELLPRLAVAPQS